MADRLRALFNTNVIQSPEHSVAGSEADAYISDAASATVLVVLLGQSSRTPVMQELLAATKAGAHVVAFTLHYPPFVRQGESWRKTPEEEFIRSQGLFVRDVSSIVELLRHLDLALARFLAKTSGSVQSTAFRQNYQTAVTWIRGAATVRRVALVQRTSLLLLGARRREPEELECFREFAALIRVAQKRTPANTRPDVVHIFDRERTLADARKSNYRDAYGESLPLGVLRAAMRSGARNPKVRFSAAESDIASVLLVNNKVALTTPLGQLTPHVVLVEDQTVADRVFDRLSSFDHGNFDESFLTEFI